MNLDALGVASNAPFTPPDDIVERVQAEGRQMLADGRVDLYDPDFTRAAEHATVPGRIAIEPYTGAGITPGGFYVHQDDRWSKIFARVVAISPQAARREPDLQVGMRVVFERAATDNTLAFATATGGDQVLARFPLVHVDDILAILDEDPGS